MWRAKSGVRATYHCETGSNGRFSSQLRRLIRGMRADQHRGFHVAQCGAACLNETSNPSGYHFERVFDSSEWMSLDALDGLASMRQTLQRRSAGEGRIDRHQDDRPVQKNGDRNRGCRASLRRAAPFRGRVTRRGASAAVPRGRSGSGRFPVGRGFRGRSSRRAE